MAYVLIGRKSGTVRFEAEENGVVSVENESLTSRVTAYPVESGDSIEDHVINDHTKFSLSGTIIGGEDMVEALKNMRDNRDVITYIGRVRIDDLVITSLSFDYITPALKPSMIDKLLSDA